MRILLVEDDPTVAFSIRRTLEREGYEVRHTDKGREAVGLLHDWPADVILLDVGLPDTPGAEVAREIRTFSTAPIIMVTGQTGVDDRVAGLDVGADDYVVKPFAVPELLARVRAAARRAAMPKPSGTRLEVNGIVLDADARSVTVDGRPIDLKDREFELLRLLMSRAGQIVRRDEITRSIWGQSPTQAANSLHVHMSWLRSKLGDDPKDPKYIETLHGRGFRFLGD